MLVHRFIGLSELKALCADGIVKPIEGKRTCLYFFPNTGLYHFKPEYELDYCSGIVGSMALTNEKRVYCMIELDLPKDRLVCREEFYADPEGGWYDRILVAEYHLFGFYSISAVQRVVFFADCYPARKLEEFMMPRKALEFLMRGRAHDNEYGGGIDGFRQYAMTATLG